MTPFNQAAASDRIVRLYRSATPAERSQGLAWYGEAHDVAVSLAQAYNVSVSSAAGVIAALSPQSDWPQNITRARQLMAGGDTYGLGDGRRKASRIMSGEDPDKVLNGPKVRAFWSNIADPVSSTAVTVDRHSLDAALGMVTTDAIRKSILERKGGYEAVEEAYRHAARRLGVAPHVAQAVAWTAWRNRNGKFHFQKVS